MPKRSVILSVDAGGTSLKYALLGFNGSFISESLAEEVPSFGTKEELLNAFYSVFSKAIKLAEKDNSSLGAIGIAVPGPFNLAKGKSMMRHKWPALYDVDLFQAFRSFGILPEKIPIAFISDTHAFILGECIQEKARQYRRISGIILGTGLGFGCVADSVPLLNEIGGPRYIIYSKPWKESILENYVTGPGIAAQYQKKTGQSLSAKDIGALARQGISEAVFIYNNAGTFLAENIREILMEFGTECLVFGGKVSRDYDLFRSSFEQTLGNIPELKLIYASEKPETSAMLGAATLMKNRRDL